MPDAAVFGDEALTNSQTVQSKLHFPSLAQSITPRPASSVSPLTPVASRGYGFSRGSYLSFASCARPTLKTLHPATSLRATDQAEQLKLIEGPIWPTQRSVDCPSAKQSRSPPNRLSQSDAGLSSLFSPLSRGPSVAREWFALAGCHGPGNHYLQAQGPSVGEARSSRFYGKWRPYASLQSLMVPRSPLPPARGSPQQPLDGPGVRRVAVDTAGSGEAPGPGSGPERKLAATKPLPVPRVPRPVLLRGSRRHPSWLGN